MQASQRSVQITWYGQAGFRLVAGDARVLIDPFLTDRADRRYHPPVGPAELRDTRLVLCTHEHDDHMDVPFLRALLGEGADARIVVPAPVVSLAVHAGLPLDRLVAARPDEPIRAEGVEVMPLPAMHGVGGDQEPVAYGFASLRAPHEGYRFLGYGVTVGGVRVFHAGDGLVYPGLAERIAALRPDLLCLPINGRDAYREGEGTVGNMTEREAARLAHAVGAQFVVPMHYEGFANNLGDVGRFVNELGNDSPVTVLVLRRGQPVRLHLDDLDADRVPGRHTERG